MKTSLHDSNNDDTKWLWCGASVWCVCGHHIECHNTSTNVVRLFWDVLSFCKFKGVYCNCKEFIPYKKKEILK